MSYVSGRPETRHRRIAPLMDGPNVKVVPFPIAVDAPDAVLVEAPDFPEVAAFEASPGRVGPCSRTH